ncbi:MAG TPA: Na+/H+ antiporter subunit E [Burkholderiales bacterium]|nr:Na+/H+ antiporter subunit E [Burkholderiales bacterium]
MLERLSIAVSLFVFWLLLSGMFTPFLVAAGAGSALAVAWLAARMEIADREGHPVHFSVAVLTYWPWLVKEIAVSAWTVTKIILSPRLPISPTLARFKPSQKSTVGLVTHANSITLTPGTITIEAGRDEFLVHAITREGAASLEDSEMDRRVAALEGRG